MSLANPKLHFRRRSLQAEEIKETLDATLSEDENSGSRLLNQYAIQHVIGKGAYGTVHLAFNNNRQPVAIKEFSKAKLRKTSLQNGLGRFGLRNRVKVADSSPMDLVKNEVAIFKKLNHANVIRLYEVLDSGEDSLFMVFEYCEKGPIMNISLEHPATPLNLDQVRFLLQQIVLGIEYLHENDITHRDIKPDNLLISKDGTLKIVDFGVSEMFSKGDDKSDKSAGSPAFFSPELCRARHGEISSKSCDIWAIGVTLYCMCFGHVPFTGESIIDLYENIQTIELEYPLEFPGELKHLFERLLDKDPATRIKMDELRCHPWLTDNSRLQLPKKQDNCVGLVTYVTEEEIQASVKKINNLFTVIKAVNKLRSKSRSLTNLLKNGSGNGSNASLNSNNSSLNKQASRENVLTGEEGDLFVAEPLEMPVFSLSPVARKESVKAKKPLSYDVEFD